MKRIIGTVIAAAAVAVLLVACEPAPGTPCPFKSGHVHPDCPIPPWDKGKPID
ncbi:MAG TPA: hypothetical protein VHK88_20135 [Aquihabitans sp.]|nr:hypothetical protein [Aquihabitans sp.]